MSGDTKLSDEALEVHAVMLSSKSSNGSFTRPELQEATGITSRDILMGYIQELLNHKMVQLSQDSAAGLCFQAVSAEEAEKVQKMSGDEAMVYSYIEAAGREGIWTKTIKMRSNLHQTIVSRCLKSLEGQRYIKAVKSVKYPTRKIYMLASLQPSVEVTGGPWFTDSELDSEFIQSLLTVTWRHVVSLTFPHAFESDNFPPSHNGPQQASYPSNYDGYPTVNQIHRFVADSGVTNVELGVSDIRALCEVLVYDDKLERRDKGHRYRATWQSVVSQGGGFEGDDDDDALDGFTEAPCARCPVFDHCGHEGPVNSEECVYYDEWLNN